MNQITVAPIMQEYVPLAPMTTLGIGGPARFFVTASTQEAVAQAAAFARERGLPVLVLGGGSNMLISDDGFPGMVLRIAIDGIKTHIADGVAELTAGAGVNWHMLVSHAVRHNWMGVECLGGIPGLVGATPVQNVGAYGQDVRETIARVEALDLSTGDLVTFSNAECRFAYRESRFKLIDRGRYVILAVTYHLLPGSPPKIRYGEVDRLLAARDITAPTLADVHAAVLEIRQQKSMLLNASDPNTRSVGSFFMNPILTAEQYAAIERAAGLHIPTFPVSNHRVKIPAAWLIEHAGFARGHVFGNVGLSTNHSLAIINRGGASAVDVLMLARLIRDRVREHFGITLQPEPALIGFAWD